MNLNAQRASKAYIKFDIEVSRVGSSDLKRKGSRNRSWCALNYIEIYSSTVIVRIQINELYGTYLSSDCSIASGYNIAAYSLLTHLIAQQCDLAVGEFIWSVGDIHGYGNQFDDIREMVKRETHPFPQIKIKKAKDLYSYEWSDIEIIDYQHSGKMENLKVAI